MKFVLIYLAFLSCAPISTLAIKCHNCFYLERPEIDGSDPGCKVVTGNNYLTECTRDNIIATNSVNNLKDVNILASSEAMMKLNASSIGSKQTGFSCGEATVSDANYVGVLRGCITATENGCASFKDIEYGGVIFPAITACVCNTDGCNSKTVDSQNGQANLNMMALPLIILIVVTAVSVFFN